MTKVNPLKETVPSSLALVLKSCMKVKYYLQHLRMLQNPPDFTKVAPALEVLARLLFHNDFDVLADTCWALR